MTFTRALFGLSLAFIFLAYSFAAPADESSPLAVLSKEDVTVVDADVEISPSAKHHPIIYRPGKYPVKHGHHTTDPHDCKHTHTLFDHSETKPEDHDGPLAFLDQLRHSFRLAMCNKFGLCMPFSNKFEPIHFPSTAHFLPHGDHEDTDDKHHIGSMFDRPYEDKLIFKPFHPHYDNKHVPHHMSSEDGMHHHDSDKHHSNEGHYESSHKPGYQSVHHSSHKPETHDHHTSSHQSNPHGESSHKRPSGHIGPMTSLLDALIKPLKVYKPVPIEEHHHESDHKPLNSFPHIAHHGSDSHGNHHHHDEGHHSEGHGHHDNDHHDQDHHDQDHHDQDHHENHHEDHHHHQDHHEDHFHHQDHHEDHHEASPHPHGGHQHPILIKPHHYGTSAIHKPLFRLPWSFTKFKIV